MLVATTVLTGLFLVALGAATFTRLSLAAAFVRVGSALAVFLTVVSGGNVVGGIAFETTVLAFGGIFYVSTMGGSARRQRNSARRRRQHQQRRPARETRLAA